MWPNVILPVVSIVLSLPGVYLSINTLIDRHTDRRPKKEVMDNGIYSERNTCSTGRIGPQ